MSKITAYQDELVRVAYEWLKDANIVIPVYQRQYKWESSQVETLLKDIFDNFKSSLSKDEDKDFWLGVIFVASDRGKVIIVDGQQRVMTMFLIFKVFLETNFKEKQFNSVIDDLKIHSKSKHSLFKEIINYLVDDERSDKVKFNEIKNVIQNYKNKIEHNDNFSNYLKNNVKLAILNVEQKEGYDYFRKINSKLGSGTPLTLSEQCLSFLLKSDNISEIKKDKPLFEWLLSDSPYDKTTDFDSDLLFETFVQLFEKKKIDSEKIFMHFVDIVSSDKGSKFDQFIEFLNIVKQLKDNKLNKNRKKTFASVYFNQICFNDYWRLAIKLNWENECEKCFEHFLDNIWKIDLMRWIFKSNKNIPNLIKKYNTIWKSCSDYNNFMQKLADGIAEITKTKIIFEIPSILNLRNRFYTKAD